MFLRSYRALALSGVGFLAALALMNPAPVLAGTAWDLAGHHGPARFEAGGIGEYSFILENSGNVASEGPISMHIELPAGVTTRKQNILFQERAWSTVPPGSVESSGWECGPQDSGLSSLTCTALIDPVTPDGNGLPRGLGSVTVYVAVDPSAVGPLAAIATVEGGGASPVSVTESASMGTEFERFGIEPDSVQADAYNNEGEPERRAGSHPFRVAAAFDFNRQRTVASLFGLVSVPGLEPIDTVREVRSVLPRGFLANPLAVTRCPSQLFSEGAARGTLCPPSSQVGVISVTLERPQGPSWPPAVLTQPVYNLVPPVGSAAALGFQIDGRYTVILGHLDPTDYSVIARVPNINETEAVHAQRLILWGNPSDPVHDSSRWNSSIQSYGASFNGEARPFVSLGTQCGVASVTSFEVASWHKAFDGPYRSRPAELNDCSDLGFRPSIVAKPMTARVDAPTGLAFNLHIPQNEDMSGRVSAHLRDAVVVLPRGLTVNPPSAYGLAACSMAQVGIRSDAVPNGDPVDCPDASELGTLEAISPAVDHTLKGTVYLAEQESNPFESLLALYLVVEDPETGVLVKLPGRVDADPQTGQLTATFKNNPQLPVEDLKLNFFDGPRAVLRTPASCGTFQTTGTLTPWSAPEAPSVAVNSSFELTTGPDGGACPLTGSAATNSPSFTAGTLNPIAKAYSPFVLKLTRGDGTQELKSIDTLLPKGLLGRLARTTYCSDAVLAVAAGKSGKVEQASPSCPSTSHIGTVMVGAGAGPAPLYVGGNVYLTGPYKGAPLGIAIITPAVAGPFDLGTVVTRAALYVDPLSAQVHVMSDEVPRIIQGIPLDIRSVALKLDRPEFTLNPTNCDPMAIQGSTVSIFDKVAPLSERFQVANCERLGFKPELALRLSGQLKRSGNPALRAVLTQPKGSDANIAGTQVILPKTAFIDNAHINNPCTRVQFNQGACPPKSILGTAAAYTPLLDQPLEGPVYFRSNGGERELPDMVVDLNGQIHVTLVGFIDSVKVKGTESSRLRTRFFGVPDAPVSRFVLSLYGGKRGLIENSVNYCRAGKRSRTATVKTEGQNGKVHDFEKQMRVVCGKRHRGGGHGGEQKRHRR